MRGSVPKGKVHTIFLEPFDDQEILKLSLLCYGVGYIMGHAALFVGIIVVGNIISLIIMWSLLISKGVIHPELS